MTMNLLVAIILTLSCVCDALPNCCFGPSHYSDFFSAFSSCNLTCSFEHEHALDICAPCLTQKFQIQNNSNGLGGIISSKPVITCQNLVLDENKLSGQIMLTWSLKNIFPPPIFIIEVRNSTPEEWKFVGMTNETVAHINSLDIASEYQFSVTPLVMPNLILPPLISDWILTLGTKAPISTPRNVTANNFKLDDSSAVEVTIEWNPSRENPCSYIMYWVPSSTGEFYSEKTFHLPNDTLSTVLSGLSFQTKYTLKLGALDPTSSQKVTYVQTSFETPSCLTLTQGNFTLCAPGPPLNLAYFYIPDFKVSLTWLPPKYASPENQVSQYQISVIEAPEKEPGVLRYKENYFVEKDVLNVTVLDLKPSTQYYFQVRAVGYVGVGPPALTQFGMEALGLNHQPIKYVPWYYIVPSFAFALVVIIVAVIRSLCRRKEELSSRRGYPTGSADVPDHALPFLLPPTAIELQDVVGEGEFGVVHKGVFSRKKDKEVVAVKVLSAESVSRNNLLQEVNILQTLGRHRNVVSLIGFSLDVDKTFLVLEYCALGNLHNRLCKLKKELLLITRQSSHPMQALLGKAPDEQHGIRLCSYVHQIALGMDHISSLKMIHRDLAARNILLCTENHVKIADFGLSKDVKETLCYTMSKQKKVPLRWMAPEAIENHTFTTQSDVWSFGVLVWEIFKFGKVPYSTLCSHSILTNLKSGCRLPKPPASTHEWYDLMRECWHISPYQRPTFKELVNKTGDLLSKRSHYKNLNT